MNKIREMRIVRIVMLVALCAGASSAVAHVPVDGDKYSRDHIAGFERKIGNMIIKSLFGKK